MSHSIMTDYITDGMKRGTSQGIADWLKSIGVKGYRGDRLHNPIARALLKRFRKEHDVYQVEACISYIYMWSHDCLRSFQDTTQMEIAQFLRDFDDGKYPELEKREIQ